MSFGSEHRLPPDVAAEVSRKARAGTEHLVWAGLTVLLAVVAGCMLLLPVDFHETAESSGGPDKSVTLTCGSVVSPHAERTDDGFSRYRGQCTARRTQRAGYAGLTLTGALVVLAVGLAARRRQSGAVAVEWSCAVGHAR